MRRVSVLVSVLALVAPVLLVLGGSPARAAGIQHYRFLEAQVFTSAGLGSVAVGMPNKRTVKIQHLDPATGAWDAPSVLYRKKGVTCGEIDGRSSPGGVALLLECDTPYYEDQAPAHSVALVSRDLRAWSAKRLPGEAYKSPAISPSGGFAAWLTGGTGDYVLWSAQGGFAPVAATTYDYDGYGETPVVDDAGTVSVLGPENRGRDCVVGVHTRDLAGVQSHIGRRGRGPRLHRGRARERRCPHRHRWRPARLPIHPQPAGGGCPVDADPDPAERLTRAGQLRRLAQSHRDGVRRHRAHRASARRDRQPGPAPGPDPGLRRHDLDLGAADGDLHLQAEVPRRGQLLRPAP